MTTGRERTIHQTRNLIKRGGKSSDYIVTRVKADLTDAHGVAATDL